MQVARPGRAIAHLHALGLLAHILPEALAMIGVEQSPPHVLPVFEHTLAVMDQGYLLDLDDPKTAFLAPFKPLLQDYLDVELASGVRRRTIVPMIALLHDIGKPATFQRGSDGRIRFWNHARVGAALAQTILIRWRVSGQATQFVTTAVEHHLRPLLLASQNAAGKRAIHRFLVATAETAPAVALLALMDHLGTYSHYQDDSAWQTLTDVVFKICQAYFTPKPPPLLTGTEVMAYLRIPPGPIIGQALTALREAQAVEEVATVDEAKAFIIQLGQERGWLAVDETQR
jgi:poly(A) polymerase